jgi:hypothetical protein
MWPVKLMQKHKKGHLSNAVKHLSNAHSSTYMSVKSFVPDALLKKLQEGSLWNIHNIPYITRLSIGTYILNQSRIDTSCGNI